MYVQHGLPAIFHLISKLVQKGHFSSIYHPLSLVLLDGVFSNLLDLNWYCNDLISCSYMCIQFLDNHVMTFFFFFISYQKWYTCNFNSILCNCVFIDCFIHFTIWKHEHVYLLYCVYSALSVVLFVHIQCLCQICLLCLRLCIVLMCFDFVLIVAHYSWCMYASFVHFQIKIMYEYCCIFAIKVLQRNGPLQ